VRASQGLDGPRPGLCSSGQEHVAGISRHKAAAKGRGTSGGDSSGGAAGSLLRRSAAGVSRIGIGGTGGGGRTWKGVHES
jgi:hypothetical protein